MQSRLDRIEALINEGHTLEKKWGYYPDLKSSSGKSVNFSDLSSVSLDLLVFLDCIFCPWVVCAQIREWSYFYFVCIVSLLVTAANIFFDTSSGISFVISFCYANMFPYLRYLAKKRDVQEISKGSSIVIGFSLGFLALVPSFILAGSFL